MNRDDALYKYIDVQVGRRVKSANPMGAINFKPNKISSNNSSSVAANRNYTLSNMGKAPEAMIKISGSSKDMSKIASHISYISRNGEIDIKNKEGESLNKDDVKGELEAWSNLGIANENGTKREALHLVFSMPEGTNPQGLLKAVENFAEQEFTNNNYMYAQHLDTKHPHVHLAVSVRDMQGNRLNPRKADIGNWRKIFAQKLREQGIDAVATTRQQRMKVHKGYDQTVRHIDEKSKKTGTLSKVTINRLKEINTAINNLTGVTNPHDEKIKKTMARISVNYKKIIDSKNHGLDAATLKNLKELLDNYKMSDNFLTRNEMLIAKLEEKTRLNKDNPVNKDKERGKDHDR